MWPWDPWRQLRARQVLVNLKTGNAIRGALVERRGPLVFLAGAQLLEPGRDPVTVDGQVVVERGNVDFWQLLPITEAT